ncbi:MAG: tetratricopeptide repeat protein [Epsilonproteobacteria bacterium]|nr:tetratricopeptide repeat protein [Campylobacterota bacterium]
MLGLIFLPLFLFGLTLNVSYIKLKIPVEILTISHKNPFYCKSEEKKVICYFDELVQSPVFKDKTYYFRIIPKVKKGFSLEIRVTSSYKLMALRDDLINKPLLSPYEPNKSKKWVIIAPRVIKKSGGGLDLYFTHATYPHIGAVDENLNPIKTVQSQDVLRYFAILKSYKKGADVTDDIDAFIKNFPNSIFIPDVLYLKLKILDKKGDSESVIKLGKEWIKKYAFSEKLPEVLLIIGKNYSKMGFVSDASYYFNRIITEYPKTKYAFMAMIYLADQLYSMGDDKKALRLYKEALYNTTNLETASIAAARLAQRALDKGNIKEAIAYYEKIYKANKEFLLKDKNKAYELAKTLASHNVYKLAIQIGEDILKRLKKLDDLYEPLLYHLAMWAYEDNDYDLAMKFINKYLKEFPYGDYSDQVSALRDKVLFQVPDANITKRLADIDKILKKYTGDIRDKALVEKAKLLFKLKKYKEILNMEQNLSKVDDKIFKDKKKFLKEVQKAYVLQLLKNKQCIDFVKSVKKYKITLPKKYDEEVYKCAMEAKDYDLASVVCNKYLDSPDDNVFIKWMKRKIKAIRGMGDYKSLIIAIDDLCGVMKKGCYPYMLEKFFALWKLGEYKKALKLAKLLEKYQDIRNADAFIKIVNWALNNKNYLLAATYAKKIIDLQNKFKAHPYSPFVDFIYAKYTNDKQEAIKVLKSILPKLKGENRARALFMLANLTKKREYLKECVDINGSKLWRGLCKDAYELLK